MRSGVVGLGAIGAVVTEAALDLGMKVIGFDPALSVEAALRLPGQVKLLTTSVLSIVVEFLYARR